MVIAAVTAKSSFFLLFSRSPPSYLRGSIPNRIMFLSNSSMFFTCSSACSFCHFNMLFFTLSAAVKLSVYLFSFSFAIYFLDAFQFLIPVCFQVSMNSLFSRRVSLSCIRLLFTFSFILFSISSYSACIFCVLLLQASWYFLSFSCNA